MQNIIGPAKTFISHCRAGTWGDLVAAVCDGDAERSRHVWIDIFACRQWPSSHPDLDFRYTIPNCSSFLLVCSHLKEVEELDRREVVSGQTRSLPKQIIDQIAFLRVWCLTEIDTAVKCKESKGMPIMMKRSSFKKIQGKDLFEFKHNIEMLKNMSYLIDIRQARPTVPQDKERILKEIRGGKDGVEYFLPAGKYSEPRFIRIT